MISLFLYVYHHLLLLLLLLLIFLSDTFFLCYIIITYFFVLFSVSLLNFSFCRHEADKANRKILLVCVYKYY